MSLLKNFSWTLKNSLLIMKNPNKGYQPIIFSSKYYSRKNLGKKETFGYGEDRFDSNQNYHTKKDKKDSRNEFLSAINSNKGDDLFISKKFKKVDIARSTDISDLIIKDEFLAEMTVDESNILKDNKIKKDKKDEEEKLNVDKNSRIKVQNMSIEIGISNNKRMSKTKDSEKRKIKKDSYTESFDKKEEKNSSLKKKNMNLKLEIEEKLSSKKKDQIHLRPYSFSQNLSQQNKINIPFTLNEDVGSETNSMKNDYNSFMNTEEDSKITYEFRDKKKEYLYGLHSVEAAITFSLRKNLDLFVQMSYKENTPSHIQRIIEMAKAKKIKIKYLTAIKMDKFTGNRPHNGLVLKCESRDYLSIKTFNSIKGILKKPKGNLLLLLDQIVDPQNLGSIIRTAFYLGTDRILLNKSNKPPINSTVCKVSSGASECIDLYSVKSVKSFLAEAITQGWIVATTSIEKESEVQMRSNIRNITRDVQMQDSATESMTLKVFEPIKAKKISLEEFDLTKEDNIIVVLGSEANGIISDLSGVAHYNIFIPPRLNKQCIWKAPFDIIDSLNVGVSAGIIINHVKSKLMFNEKN